MSNLLNDISSELQTVKRDNEATAKSQDEFEKGLRAVKVQTHFFPQCTTALHSLITTSFLLFTHYYLY